jgi:hypothetical protein
MPSRMPATQNQVRFGAQTAIPVVTSRDTIVTRIVFLPPILSSRNPKANAPAPDAMFNTMPNTMISLIVMPNVPAA